MAILVAGLLIASGLQTVEASAGRGPSRMPGTEADSLTVSFITCWPGSEVYALCGHEAIRIRSAKMDSVWNYGLFDFDQPNFVYRFVKGETDYRLGSYPFAWFLPEYVNRGSRVEEQDLNLTQEEAGRLLKMLQRESLPGRNVYRYNYVKDNCATRPFERLEEATGMKVELPDTLRHGTYRKEMRAYHANYPWYQFGIDLVLGSGLDVELTPREEMFVPVEMHRNLSQATFIDGRPVVRENRVLNEGSREAVEPPTPWYAGPLFWSFVALAICVAAGIVRVRTGRRLRAVYALYYAFVGFAGVTVWFLVLFSSHEATSPNLLKWWLSPLALIVPVSIWFNRLNVVTAIVLWYEMIAAALLLILWPTQSQSTSAAVFPLMLCAVALGAAYAIKPPVKSYKKSAKSGRPARKPGGQRIAKKK